MENQVEWDGSIPNTNVFDRLGRNVGEVLGVFGKADLRKPNGLDYPNTARMFNLLMLEGYSANLWAPQWPERILGPINQTKAELGEALYQTNCVSCHIVVPHGPQDTEIVVTMTPVSEIHTDPKMAWNACSRMVDTAQLEGVKMPPVIGPALSQKVTTLDLVANVTIGAVLYPVVELIADLFKAADLNSGSDEVFNDIKNIAEQLGLDGEKLSDDEMEKLRSVLYAMSRKSSAPSSEPPDCDPENELMAYKGRPLDGIWATAPYLHNGSVANLYEILLPPEERMKEFYVGSQNFDPLHVGFETKSGPGTFLLDTSKSGNSNAGHIFGNNEFTEDQREQLVEYLKTL